MSAVADLTLPTMATRSRIMRRRDSIALVGASAAWPLAAQTQQPQMKRVGFTSPLEETDPDAIRYLRALQRGLAKQGWVESRVSIAARWGVVTDAQAQQNVA